MKRLCWTFCHLLAVLHWLWLTHSPHCSRPDHESLQPAAVSNQLEYPRPDGEITFDIASSLYRSGTNHEHDQPPHLHLRNAGIPAVVNKPIYDGPESRYCPAGMHQHVVHCCMWC